MTEKTVNFQGRDYPVLPAVLSDDGKRAYAWCRYCDKFHIHGHRSGHRAAHCFVEDSPYRGTGYILDVVAGTQESMQPPREERRRPRRRKYLNYGFAHGWKEEREGQGDKVPHASRVSA